MQLPRPQPYSTPETQSCYLLHDTVRRATQGIITSAALRNSICLDKYVSVAYISDPGEQALW